MKNKIPRLFKALSLLFLAICLISSLASCFDREEAEDLSPLYTRAELEQRIETAEPLDARHVYTYLKYWRFPTFNDAKIYAIENAFKRHYVTELPAAEELAKATAECFFEYFIEDIDLQNESEVTDALANCLTYCVGDNYAIYRTPSEYDDYDTDMSGELIGIGVEVVFNKLENTCLIENLIVGGGAADAGILPGDYIVAVDGRLVSEMGYNKTLSSIKGEVGTDVEITVNRGGRELSFVIERRHIVIKSVSYSIEEGNIGYIKITDFKDNTPSQFKEAVTALEEAGCVGVIYDVRDNPGGYLSSVFEILSYIAPKNTQIVSFSNDYGAPMKSNDPHTFLVPSVVICNSRTASASELFTASLCDFGEMGLLKVAIVGEKTFGKGIMQNTYSFSDSSTITMTVAYFYSPLGKNYHGVGITPNYECENMENALTDAFSELNKLLNK